MRKLDISVRLYILQQVLYMMTRSHDMMTTSYHMMSTSYHMMTTSYYTLVVMDATLGSVHYYLHYILCKPHYMHISLYTVYQSHYGIKIYETLFESTSLYARISLYCMNFIT